MRLDAETLHRPASHRSSSIASVLCFTLVCARPGEWIKNTALFAPLFFSQHLLNADVLLKCLVGFGFFCLATGGVYLINDICDQDSDKKHPRKSTRPIASGALPVIVAIPAAIFLLGTALIGAFVLNPPFGLVTLGYVLLNIAYSNWLKHLVILDVFSIAAGFILRVVAGAVLVGVVMSHWLLICTMLLALFLGFSKRRYELVNLATDASLHRRVLAEYDPLFLDIMIGIVTSVTVIAYVLYTISEETVQRFHTDKLVLTVPFVLYGIFRYLYQVYHKGDGGDPSRTLITDGPLIINIVLWGVSCGLIIYGADLLSNGSHPG
jgi:4-hydroxybenzoate polyprenyltransferase